MSDTVQGTFQVGAPIRSRVRILGNRRSTLALALVWLTALPIPWLFVLPGGLSASEGRQVEIVLARSEHQAKVAARLMWTGFLVDMLLIPETTYLGKVPFEELKPGLQGALGDARPGEPQLLVGSGGQFLVARIMPQLPPAILGAEEYAKNSQEIWAVLSVGPTDPELLSWEMDVETGDLAAICRAKKASIQREAEEARAGLEALASKDPASPSRELIAAYARVISVDSLQGELGSAIETVGALDARLAPPAPGNTASPDLGIGKREVQSTMTHRILGILELRRGEVENCLRHHHREMCLFPLSEPARHVEEDGAKKAFQHFSAFLTQEPDDLEVRWLLNIAAMTLGRYPDGVEEKFRIGPESFESTVDPGRFYDIAMPAGVGLSDSAGGSVTDDFNGDGLLDIVVSSRDPCAPLRLYRNRGDGSFADQTEAVGLSDQLGGLNVTQTDFDNDGRLDLFVMRGGWETSVRNSLLRNRPGPDGEPVFEDVTESSGLGGLAHRTHSATWADFDGDGWLDVFVGHEFSFSQLFRNRGDGSFEDVTDKAGMRFRSFTKGATWGDVNGDGWPDLYVSNFGERNLLFINHGDGTFDERALVGGVAEPIYSFATWFWDFDNDGHEDLFVTSFLQTVDEIAREYLNLEARGEKQRVYRGRGDGTFSDVSEALGLDKVIPVMGANYGDINNDGYLDIYLGTGAPSYGMLIPNRLFLNQPAEGGGRRFVDVTTATGTGHLQKGHGVSFADLDHDGDQDLFANMGGAFPGDKYPSALFVNPGHGHDWLGVELIGSQSNRPAIGARLRLEIENADGRGKRVRWVRSGGSFGASSLRQHIGLGQDARILSLEVEWPARRQASASGEEITSAGAVRSRVVFSEIPVNHWISITEGEDAFRELERPSFSFEAQLEAGAGEHRH